MNFELVPPIGIGPLRIGMSRDDATRALDSLSDVKEVSAADQAGQHIFRPSGLMVSIGCMHNRLESVELGRPSAPSDLVGFRGIDVFGLPAREVVRRMAEVAAIEPADEAPASFVAADLLLSFWRPFEADAEPDEEQGYYFSSVLLARPGYYDHPALDRSSGQTVHPTSGDTR
ncbi:hypothetical protein ACIHCV_42055 [Streptomyces sp. NPDC051956]|uniref:hypothetical protein n=1 Tax=Streptomyces sp. NPDC051956 TaxID=3365677 RepID=UPI0037D6C32E